MRSALLFTLPVLAWMAAIPGAADDTKTKPAVQARPQPPIYDEKADTRAALHKALAVAGKENKRVLIQWGANWCPWCHVLYRYLKSDRTLAKYVFEEYELVLVDVGHRDKNMDLAKNYGVDLSKNGIPYLTVLDAEKKVLVNQATESFEKADKKEKGYESAKLLDFLKKYQVASPKASEVLAGALKEADRSNKRLFVHFGAPWCGWCRHLEAWLAQPDIESIMTRDYVDLKIDIDRMPGGQAILDRYCSKPGGIPWIVILDPGGKPLITSDGPKGNIGFPAEDHEIAHFVNMIQATKRSMSDPDVEHLRDSLGELGKKYLRRPQPAKPLK